MNELNYEKQAEVIMKKLSKDPYLAPYVDFGLPVPKPFGLGRDIKLIILGQDPTVKNEASRKKIQVVLNLNRNGALKTYLKRICAGIEIDIDQHVFATNLAQNFFVDRPTELPADVLARAATYWAPLLQAVLAITPKVSVISLGEPLLKVIATSPAPQKVREYWGYKNRAPRGNTDEFRYLKPIDNILGRRVYPMPHQPSIGRAFYKNTLDDYIKFIKTTNKGSI